MLTRRAASADGALTVITSPNGPKSRTIALNP